MTRAAVGMSAHLNPRHSAACPALSTSTRRVGRPAARRGRRAVGRNESREFPHERVVADSRRSRLDMGRERSRAGLAQEVTMTDQAAAARKPMSG